MADNSIGPVAKPTLTLTVGLPRSGKSTWAKASGYPVVNPDSIRLVLHGQPFLPEREPEVWRLTRLMVEALFQAGHQTVVLDATNVTRKRRDAWRSDNWRVRFVVFPADKWTCQARAVMTNQDYLLPVIDRMAGAYEPLTPQENEVVETPQP